MMMVTFIEKEDIHPIHLRDSSFALAFFFFFCSGARLTFLFLSLSINTTWFHAIHIKEEQKKRKAKSTETAAQYSTPHSPLLFSILLALLPLALYSEKT